MDRDLLNKLNKCSTWLSSKSSGIKIVHLNMSNLLPFSAASPHYCYIRSVIYIYTYRLHSVQKSMISIWNKTLNRCKCVIMLFLTLQHSIRTRKYYWEQNSSVIRVAHPSIVTCDFRFGRHPVPLRLYREAAL